MIRRWFRSLSKGKEGELLSPAAFRDLYLAYFKKRQFDCEIEVKGDLELKIKTAGEGAAHGVYLDNAYQQYSNDPENRDEIIETYIQSFLDVLNQKEAPVEKERIVPVIKDRGWLDEILAGIKERGGNPDDMPVYLSDFYNSELAIFYAEDSERNIRYLTEDVVQDLGVDRATLLDLAKGNLKRLVNGIEISGGDGLFLVTAGGDYEASLMLLDGVWNPEQMPVKGDYVVAIPARDLLIVTGTGHPEAIERLREMANEGAEQFSYSLSPVLFVRRDGKFEVFEG